MSRAEHLRKRAALMTHERDRRFDAAFKKNATNEEKDADKIIQKIRVKEANEVWGATSDKTLSYLGTGFLATNDQDIITRDVIANTKLYQIIRKMPKGGLLRVHFNTMYDPENIYQLALKYLEKIYVKVDIRISHDKPLPPPEFTLKPDWISKPPLTDPNYQLGTWVRLDEARNAFSGYGGPEGFDKWIIGYLRLSGEKRSTDNGTPFRAWGNLRLAFRAVGGFIFYEPILREFLRRTLLAWVDDGISYSEIRVNFPSVQCIREDGTEMSHREFVVLFDEVVKKVKRELGQARADEFVGAKIIYATFRFKGDINKAREKVKVHMEACMVFKKAFPDLIAGFDFLGPEDGPRSLEDFLDLLLWFQSETKSKKLDIPFLFMTGETLEDGSVADTNLYDAVLLESKRIGHGLTIFKHPTLTEMIKSQRVAVEVCPLSNSIIGLASAAHHPLLNLLNNDVPAVLCSDNPGAFRNWGLSFDFYQIMAGSFETSLLSLKRLALNSLEYSTLKKEDKDKATAAWGRRWDAFVKKVIKENSSPPKL